MYAPLGCGTRSLSFRLHFGADPSKDGFIYGEGQRQKKGVCVPIFAPFLLLYFTFFFGPSPSSVNKAIMCICNVHTIRYLQLHQKL